MTDTGDDTGSGRWMSYDALAELRHISRIGAVRLVQRRKWRRMAGNDGRALVLVPHDMLAPVRGSAAGKAAGELHGDSMKSAAGDAAANAADNAAGIITAMREAFDSALRAKDQEIAAKDALIEELRAAAMRSALAGATARERLTQVEQELKVARDKLAEKDAERARGLWQRLRAAWRGAEGAWSVRPW